MNKSFKAVLVSLIAMVTSVFAGSVSAAMADDVASAIAEFASVNTAIPIVGGAFLLALGILAAWKLIRGAFA